MSDHKTILWRRIDAIGHDACRIFSRGGTWTIEGTSISLENGKVSRLDYQVLCSEAWLTSSGRVSGWIGDASINLVLERNEESQWAVNGVKVPDIDGLMDLDLGFTPATNTNAIKRMNLQVGRKSETVAAWLDTADWTVKPLAQAYRRLDEHTFEYQSPDHGYREKLQIDDFGFVVNYPQLWVRER